MRKNMRKNYLENTKVAGDVMFELKESELNTDIVNIGLHFILKNVRPYAAPCSEA